jgi:ABC-type siderophore export system fused ATPase/permease subunit
MTGDKQLSAILGLKKDLRLHRRRNRELEQQLAEEKAAREKAEADLVAFQRVFSALTLEKTIVKS